jgi:hypothetical protein
MTKAMQAAYNAYNPEPIHVPALAIYAVPKSADELMRRGSSSRSRFPEDFIATAANDPALRARVEKLFQSTRARGAPESLMLVAEQQLLLRARPKFVRQPAASPGVNNSRPVHASFSPPMFCRRSRSALQEMNRCGVYCRDLQEFVYDHTYERICRIPLSLWICSDAG